jgi:hypothetical protein
VDRVLYVEQIKRYLTYFPRENMLFLLYENFKKNPAETVKQCLEFFELPVDLNLIESSPARNITRLPRSVDLQWLAYRYFYKRFRLGYKLVSKLNLRRQVGYPRLADETKQKLDEFYRPYNIQFSQLTNLDISSWQ